MACIARHPVCLPLLLAAVSVSCAAPTVSQEPEREIYVAQLHPLNERVAGRAANGTARFAVDDEAITITVQARGLAPDMPHLQHYHGFPSGQQARCPTGDADWNGDGVIDLIETEPVAGVTLVPLHEAPSSLEIARGVYPLAEGPEGSVEYEKTVDIQALSSALSKRFRIGSIVLEKRVVFIHGVAPDTPLPPSVQSLPGVAPQATLPVACGEIRRLR